MNEKFSQFFKGKMSKSVYISAVSTVLCGAVAITSTVVVHNKNKKIDSILKNTVSSSSTTESVTESALSTESKSAESSVESVSNSEPANDKAMQYLKEYEKITAEYEKKRAELSEKIAPIPKITRTKFPSKPQLRPRSQGGAGNWLETEEEYASYVAQYELNLKKWEEESVSYSIEESKADEQIQHHKTEQEKIQNQIEQLDEKYKRDIENLKKQYGI